MPFTGTLGQVFFFILIFSFKKKISALTKRKKADLIAQDKDRGT